MKNGLLIYSSEYSSFNIGDYIQSLAAKQYFQSDVDVYICREELNKYHGDDVKLIMNGWFTHKPYNWPPSEKIHPLFVSFHMNSVATNELTNPVSISYLKNYKVGCRDQKTVSNLKEKGVDAYFTGCLTLTLGRTYKRSFIDDNIYFVDPFFPFEKKISCLLSYLKVLLSNFFKIKKISKKLFGSTDVKSLLKTSAFYQCYNEIFEDDVLIEAIYLKHEFSVDGNFVNDSEKFDYADNLLKKYTTARYVVTSRIHCALPCLGIGTPVLYVNDENQSETSFCRLDGIIQLFNSININNNTWSCDFIQNKKIGKSFNFKNKNLHENLKENLIKICNDFLLDS